MKSVLEKYQYPLLLLLVLFLAECVVQPLSNIPLNDDWSYSKSVKILLETNTINIGNWGAMTLVTQILWGFVWTKTFGFSFVVLRLSTIFSAWVGTLILYSLIKDLTKSARAGFWTTLCFSFLPVYFNLTNTFMTDVNFCTLLVSFIWMSYRFIKSENLWYLLPLFVLSLMLTFLRQFGIIAPAALLFSLLFANKRKPVFLLIVAVNLVLVYLSLRAYENYLSTILKGISTYKFSSEVPLFDSAFYSMLAGRLSERFPSMIVNLLFYSSPVAILFVKPLIKENSLRTNIIAAILSISAVYFFLPIQSLLMGNVLQNMSLGPEAFYESLTRYQTHYASNWFQGILNVLVFVGVSALGFVIISRIAQVIEKKKVLKLDPFSVLLGTLFITYVFMILITGSYFDRYYLPLILISILLLAPLYKGIEATPRLGWIVAVPMLYCSVAGTHDYIEMNKKRWEAFAELRSSGIDRDKINAGFEINCWRDGEVVWWINMQILEGYDYLVQFSEEPGFKKEKEFPYQGWFPPRQDKICIFSREQTQHP